MFVTLQCVYLERHLWQVQGNAGLMYPQTDAGSMPPIPSEPVYVDTIYPPDAILVRQPLWVQTSNVLAVLNGFEPIFPEPSNAAYVNVPHLFVELPGMGLTRVTFDGYTIAERLWDTTISQPWTPPKLEPSWWEGFKLPFNVLELDEDAPIAIQRNFKEIEHYINFLGRSAGEIRDSLKLLDVAPAVMPEEEPWEEEESEAPPTDSYFAGYLLGKEGQMGSIDAAIKTDNMGGINEVWVARVIDRQGIVEIYDSDAPEHIFRTVAREFNLPLVNLGADVVDVAIEFDGAYDQYNIFVSETEPHIFWVERTGDEDIIYTVKWGGVDPAPTPTELARAQLGNGSGITVGLDHNITI